MEVPVVWCALFRRKKEGLPLRLYLDACCLSRLTDDQSQARVHDEAEAVEGILRLVGEGRATWVSSIALEIEINRNPDTDRRRDVASLLAFANEVVVPRSGTAERATFFQKLGFGNFDALHLASAEQGQADVFLTTDDDLLRRAGRCGSKLRIRVQNPLSWYQEVAG
jgi:predicted nucleic acid-binding protein